MQAGTSADLETTEGHPVSACEKLQPIHRKSCYTGTAISLYERGVTSATPCPSEAHSSQIRLPAGQTGEGNENSAGAGRGLIGNEGRAYRGRFLT